VEIEHDQRDIAVFPWSASGRATALGLAGPGAQGRAQRVTAAPPTKTVRFTRAEIAGLAVGAVCVWRTGLLAALPSAVGLTLLAASDFRTRRVPREVFATTAAATVGLAFVDAAVQGSGGRLVAALLITAAVALVAGTIWAATSGFAFGDVKLLALAAFVPAWLQGSAVLMMVLAALVAAVGMVVVERVRVGGLTMKSSIAFGPPLLLGWLVGVLTA
jgi:Type IV leader peptidase family